MTQYEGRIQGVEGNQRRLGERVVDMANAGRAIGELRHSLTDSLTSEQMRLLRGIEEDLCGEPHQV
jgi:hypothetical protein